MEFFADMCAQVAVPESSAQAISYYHSGNILWIFQWIWTLAIPLLFLLTGFSGKLGAFSKKWGKNRFCSLLIYLAIFVGLYQLLNLPLDFYATYIREHAYGLSTQTLGRWIEHYGKITLLLFLSAAAFTWIFYLLLKKSPRRWWFYSSWVSIGIAFITTFVYPIWIDPFFNEIGPLKDKQLEKSILKLAARAGMKDGRVFEVDKSQDTTTGNAYVAGLGSTQRIVIWDTSIQGNSKEGILFIMGHEMGHYLLNHAWWGLAFFSFFAFGVSYATYKAANFLLFRYRKQCGFLHLYDIASLPLLLFLVNFFIFLLIPIFNYASRYAERESDRFGLEITQNNVVAAQLFADAAEEHLANPRPGMIYKIWRSSHPSLGDRIDFCNSYCPWKRGEPLKYGKYFQDEQ